MGAAVTGVLGRLDGGQGRDPLRRDFLYLTSAGQAS